MPYFVNVLGKVSPQSEMDYSFHRLCRDGLNKDFILNALEKIDTGDYGVCEAFEEQTPLQGLKAIPDARYCIACQMELENAPIVA